MDVRRRNQRPDDTFGQRHLSAFGRRLFVPVLCVVVPVLTGCSLVVMANKMFGDPMVDCAFKLQTRVNLVSDKKKVVVLCTVPAAVEGHEEYSGVGREILENVTLRLKTEGVRVVSADKVLDWLDDINGVWNDPDEVAEQFDVDYIIHIDIREFTHKVENSPQLFQGVTRAQVHAYRVTKEGGSRRALPAYSNEDFQSKYPPHGPQSVTRESGEQFLRKYTRRISAQLSQLFYDHPAADSVF